MADLDLLSASFNSGDAVPEKHTCEGDDVSPQLSIRNRPDGTQSLALIVDDPDAPTKAFVHWVAYNLPADTSVLAEGVDIESDLDGALQGVNDFGNNGYGGPCPPPGSTHHYHFRLYALDTRLDLAAGATKKQVTQAMDGHVLAESDLIGTFRRDGRRRSK